MAASAEDPTCGEGSHVNFGQVDHYRWSDPTLWQSAATMDDLENGKFLFSVDAERVPCHYDDVLFSPETSFRVQIQQAASEIQLRSISVLGRKFSSGTEFGEYLASHTGRLQFPGPAQPQVTDMKCQDRTGCLCGNDKIQQEICSTLLQHSGNKCPKASCANPLTPIGHCCGICGAVISLEYTSDFDLETYRSRLIHTFLNLEKYSEVKLAVSKVQPLASAMAAESLNSEPKIQVVCIDEKSGTSAVQLGRDIMEDIQNHGQSFGIAKAEMETSSDITGSTQEGSLSAGGITGIVLGVALLLSLLGLAYFLYRRDAFRFFWLPWNISRLEETESVDNSGFANPIFEPKSENEEAKPELHIESKQLSLTAAVHFSNPMFDNMEV